MKLNLNKMLLTSEEKRNEETVNQLISLWKTVFCDDEDYIRLLVPYLPIFDCYVVKEEGKIVSAFYLLPSEIKVGQRIYKGSYLYAAATYEEYRKNGYMSRLIKEAINGKENELDFISLVPANDGLYSYYSRFGFEELMYNFRTKITCDGKNNEQSDFITDGERINSLRKSKFDFLHLFTDSAMNYALSCYGHFGSHFKALNDSAVLYVEDEKTVYEGIFSEREKEDFTKLLKDSYSDEITVLSPYSICENSEKIKCGMILDFSSELKKSGGIYMNHTLI